MNASLTLCIVGAGSSYTPELVDGILTRPLDDLPITSLRLTDVDAKRLEIMTGLTRRMAEHKGRSISINSDTRRAPMLDGADFVITQVRVGGMTARHLDESIPRKYGVIGQETTGPGGMFKALRTIPVMIDIARAIERHAPDAFVLNYTNPSGIITEAVLRHSKAKIIGLCSGLPGMAQWLGERLTPRFNRLTFRAAGLNHLGFFRLLAGQREVTDEAIAYLLQLEGDDPAVVAWLRLASVLGALPIRGYSDIFYHRGRCVREQVAKQTTRAQDIAALEPELFADAADPHTTGKPKALERRGGGGYSDVTFDTLHAIVHDTGDEIVASTLNGDCIKELPADVAVEATCRMDRTGAHPLSAGPLPLAFRGAVQTVKAYETLTVEAAVTCSRKLTIQAMLNHPLVGDLDVAEPLVDELLKAHGMNYT